MSAKEVYAELVAFSSARPLWQQDVLRRIVETGSIQDADVRQAYELCKAEHGITITDPNLNAIGLSHSQSLVTPVKTDPVTLEKISEVSNVNLLANGQSLSFQATGLTVIYGHNGSGKSGYARILKGVTRCRGKKLPVLPNAFKPDTTVPRARISYNYGSLGKDYVWTADVEATDEALAQISFFDSECAGVYVDQQNDPAFTPFGLDILPTLVDVCSAVQGMLKADKAKLDGQKSGTLRNLDPARKTIVMDQLRALKPDTLFEDISKLAKISEVDQKRLNELRVMIAQGKTAALQQIQLRLQRLLAMRQTVERICEVLNGESYGKARQVRDVAQEAAVLAAGRFSSKEQLPIGSDAWKSLWESARKYSVTDAYPEYPFPHVSDKAKCVLCFQEFDQSAKDRMARFDAFVRDDTQEKYRTALVDFYSEESKLKELRITKIERGRSVEELAMEDSRLAVPVKRLFVDAQLRRRQILKSGNSNIAIGSVSELDGAIEALKKTKNELEADTGVDADATLRTEANELEDKLMLSRMLSDVEAEIGRLKEIAKLDKAIQATNTAAITRKGAELTEKYVNEAVRSRFLQELSAVGLRRTPIKLVSTSGAAGTKLWQIQIDGIINSKIGKASISQILSQGEQRAISLAAFLSELSIGSTQSALVFDDPVSSLDHRTRRAIADRLTAEAKTRQVVVFTHDIVFMLLLQESATAQTISITMQQVRRGSDYSGWCSQDIPWQAKTVNQRVGWLKNEWQRIDKIHRQGDEAAYEKEAGWLYVKLRESWERGVEEVLLNGSIVRFGRSIQTQRLRKVTDITDPDVETVEQGMTKCSMYAHDEATAINGEMPAPPEVEQDILKLEAWVDALTKRRKK